MTVDTRRKESGLSAAAGRAIAWARRGFGCRGPLIWQPVILLGCFMPLFITAPDLSLNK